jgi:hypothetical protein
MIHFEGFLHYIISLQNMQTHVFNAQCVSDNLPAVS